MAIPSTARVFTQALDPSDILDFYLGLTSGDDGDDLQVGENVASFQLTLSAEAVAAGLILMDGGRTRISANVLGFWLQANAAAQISAIFDGAGVQLPIVFTYTTDNTPPRTVQRTLVVIGRNQ